MCISEDAGGNFFQVHDLVAVFVFMYFARPKVVTTYVFFFLQVNLLERPNDPSSVFSPSVDSFGM